MAKKSKKEPEKEPAVQEGPSLNPVDIRSQIEKLGALFIGEDGLSKAGGINVMTGVLPLDMILGPGFGFRAGCVEVYGPEGVGKTSLVLSTIKWCKENGHLAMLMDVEQAMTDPLCEVFGLVPNKDFMLAQPDSAEAALNGAELFLRNSQRSVLIIDSIANLLSRGEHDEKVEEKSFNPVTLMLSKFSKRIPLTCRKNDNLLIYLNQVRDSMEKYGPSIRVPGPRAIKFNTCIRIEMRRESLIKEAGDDGEVIGQRVEFKTVKNRYARPHQKAHSHLIYGRGFHQGYDLCELVSAFGIKGVVDRNKSWFTFADGTKVNGQQAAADRIADDPELLKSIRAKILEVVS